MRGLEKIFSPVVVNAMSDTEVEAIASEPSSAKRQREFLEDRIKKLQDRHGIFRGVTIWDVEGNDDFVELNRIKMQVMQIR